MDISKYVTPGEAQRIGPPAGQLSAQRWRQLAELGQVRHVRTPSGRYLLDAEHVEELAVARAEARGKRGR